jgi:cob(I)alamin adenosyltransferase
MKIYTKTGDDGSTGLFGGGRLGKDALRVESYGTVDETNAALGVARASGLPPEIDALLAEVQADLFGLGAELACVPGKEHKLAGAAIAASASTRLERAIDAFEAELEPLANFVLPAGTPGAAQLHLCRTVCRRAERRVVALGHSERVRPELIVYLNRLSDLLFVLARCVNRRAQVPDVPWAPRG